MVVQVPRKRRIPVVILVTIILLGCAAFGSGAYLQYKQIQYVKAAIDRMPESWDVRVGEFGGSFFGDVVTLKKIRLTLPSEDGPVAVSMDGVAVKGVNAEAASTAGVSRLIERMAIGKLKFAGDGFEHTVEHLSLTGLQGDLQTLARQIKSGLKTLDPAKDRLAVLDLAVEKALVQSPRFTFTDGDAPVTVTAATAEALNFSILKTGPLTASDIRIDCGDRHWASIDRMGIDGWTLPNVAALRKLEEKGKSYPLDRNIFGGDLSLDGLHADGIRVEMPLPDGSAGTLRIGSERLSVRVADGKQSFSSVTSGLAVNKELLPAFLGAALDDAMPFLPETLAGNAEIAMDIVSLAGGTVEISMKPFAMDITGLGSIKTSFIMEMDAAPRSEDAALRHVDLTATDEGMSKLIFTVLGKQQGKTPVEVRRDVLITLGVSGIALQGPVRELHSNILSFLEKPGATFSMKLASHEAVDPQTLGFMLLANPDSVGLASSVSRAEP